MAATDRRRRGNEGGFTIVELVVVLLILGILAGIGFGVYGTEMLDRSTYTRVVSEASEAITQMDTYYLTNKAYPADGDINSVANINNTLGTNLTGDGYTCVIANDGDADGGYEMTVTIDADQLFKTPADSPITFTVSANGEKGTWKDFSTWYGN